MSNYHYNPTVILDADGTLVFTSGNMNDQIIGEVKPLPGVMEKLLEWDRMGCHIIILTGRRESSRKSTEEQLAKAGIFYDQLVMGVGGGVRILVNDRKPESNKYPDGRVTAFAVSPPRNHGIGDIDIDLLEKVGNKQELTLLEKMTLNENSNMYKS